MTQGAVLVTGGTGQLARALEAAAPGRVQRVGRPEFDFDAPQAIGPLLDRIAPAAVVNAAAYTAVDKAESEPEAADRANHTGPALLAAWCAQAGVPFVHVSTDYVFDGLKGAPYVETDPTNPTGVYGATKLAGERAVMAANARAMILRTSWVYGATGKNFVLTMLNAAARTSHLRVVADQRGCPTTTDDLAGAVLGVLDRCATGWSDHYAGVTHAAGTGWTTWHGLASAVFEAGARHGFPRPEIAAIATADWPTPARRPPDSRLDCTRLQSVFGVRMPIWQDALARVLHDVAAARR